MNPALPRSATDSALNADLHCHSSISDGIFTPEALAERAHARGVQLWALTDHDEVAGQARAQAAAQALGMDYITGVEISVTYAEKTLHIVGLGIDPAHPALVQGLHHTREGRVQRARDMATGLEAAGIEDAFEGALAFAGNPELISRTHFARHLVNTGVCAHMDAVFRRYLVEGKPGYVPHTWARMGEAVGWILAAGGVPVLAHPGRYRLGGWQEGEMFQEFIGHGGRAVEVITGSHSRSDFTKYAERAQHYGLMASRGSDFHEPGDSRSEFGALPLLPPHLTPVWSALRERIHA